jgi:hypothetical protein
MLRCEFWPYSKCDNVDPARGATPFAHVSELVEKLHEPIIKKITGRVPVRAVKLASRLDRSLHALRRACENEEWRKPWPRASLAGR